MPKRELKLNDDELIKYVTSCYKESDDAWSPVIKPVWDECWNTYRVYRDYSKKAAWQARHVSPKGFSSVETAVALVKRSLIYNRDFFTVTGQEGSDKEPAKLVKETVLFWLRKAKFYTKFIEALKSSCILGLGVLKVYWKRWDEEVMGIDIKTENEPITLPWIGIQIPFNKKRQVKREVIKKIRKSELIIETVDPYNLKIDPWAKINGGRPKYVIEIEEAELSEIQKHDKSLHPEGDGYYENTSSISEIRQDGSENSEEKRIEDNARKDYPPDVEKIPERKPVILWNFHGDIEIEAEIEEDKKYTCHENWQIVVANGQHIIRKKKNPWTHGKVPYIFIPCIIVPFRFFPIGLIEPIRASLDYMDDLYNMTLDSMRFDLLGMFGVDVDSLENPFEDLKVEPGHFIKMKGMGENINQKIQRFQPSPTQIQPSMIMINSLDRVIQNALGINDQLQGMTSSEDQTATEYRGQLRQSTLKFESVARDIEEFAINPLIEMVYQLIFQNMDTGFTVNITGEDGKIIEQYITPEKIQGNYDFYANGISGYLAELENTQKLISVFSIIAQAQPILMLSPPEGRKIVNKILEAQGLRDIKLPEMPQMPPAEAPGMPGPSQNPQGAEQAGMAEMAPENMMQRIIGQRGM